VEQLIKVMRESPYPAQRQWAAQSLTSFEWRVHPQIVPALLQSASQDPAAGVRADCVTCLGRMQASVEPVFGILHAMRNDIDPRVRQAVEQAFVHLGQAPIAPQQ
jgi:HEAT repeat protein